MSMTIYEQCCACGNQVKKQMVNGGGFSSAKCGQCGSDEVNVQIGGNTPPDWWVATEYAPIKTSGVKVDL